MSVTGNDSGGIDAQSSIDQIFGGRTVRPPSDGAGPVVGDLPLELAWSQRATVMCIGWDMCLFVRRRGHKSTARWASGLQEFPRLQVRRTGMRAFARTRDLGDRGPPSVSWL